MMDINKIGADYNSYSLKDSGVNGSEKENHSSTPSMKEIKEEIKDKNIEEKKKELQDVTEKLNKEMQPLNTSIKFGFDDKVDELYVNVIDKHTDKVIRKIPSDEALKLMAKMREIVGALFDEKG